ncbi:M4 family peptidase [Pseudonocardiaceae bacterium YIM PH 21723]|nr:M4 family peptidase [Pseudonocardiaceae bacterium YIM PH 21723]
MVAHPCHFPVIPACIGSFVVRKKLTIGAAALTGVAVLSLITHAPASVGIDSVAAATSFAADPANGLVHGDHEKVRAAATHSGPGALRYTAFTKSYKDIPVVGGSAVVVTDAQGAVLSTSGEKLPEITVDTTPKITAGQAAATAKGLLSTVDSAEAPQLVVYAADNAQKLAYEVRTQGSKADGSPSNLRVWVDAATGAILGKKDLVKFAEGNSGHSGKVTIESTKSGSNYTLVDSKRPGIKQGTSTGKKIYSKSTDVWGNGGANDVESAAVDAAYAAEKEWDLLKDWFGRNGFDGKGNGFPAYVGWNANNAHWTGSYTEFGYNGSPKQQLTAIDVVGHEYGHAIFQFSGIDGTENGETAGINESVADIFGTLTEFYANNPVDKPDYTEGENTGSPTPLRYLYKPSLDGSSPDYYTATIGNLDEHYSGGVHSHWFYLLAEGSKPANGNPESPTADGKAVTGIGQRKAANIFYSALQRKGDGWNYAKARVASLQAAKELYGADSIELKTTKAAWDAVKVPAQAGEPTV